MQCHLGSKKTPSWRGSKFRVRCTFLLCPRALLAALLFVLVAMSFRKHALEPRAHHVILPGSGRRLEYTVWPPEADVATLSSRHCILHLHGMLSCTPLATFTPRMGLCTPEACLLGPRSW
jgi:hypothetical protein